VLWHSTGANNAALKRYVQPSSDDPNRKELLELIGVNNYNNSWNRQGLSVGVNAFIGKLADGTVATAQTLPWNMRPWGCGSGPKGSCNSGWIQFEICEDSTNNKDYFELIYKEACELTAYLCKMYNLDPYGYATLNGVKVPVIICHADSHDLGLGSNHGDIYHWFKKYGKDMDDVRNDVAELLNAEKPVEPKPTPTPVTPVAPTSEIKKGDIVKLTDDAVYYSGKSIPLWVKSVNWIVSEVSGDRAIINKSVDGKYAINSPVNVKYLILVENEDPKPVPAPEEFKPYTVQVMVQTLNYRSGPGTNYPVKGTISKGGVYTIVEESGKWGKLKSGAGWICLDYVKKR
jgi:hypothetical protein